MKSDPEHVLSFWFGELDDAGLADEQHTRRWFTKDAAFDAELTERFGALHAELARGERDDWLSSDRGRLAYVVVLDQFSRNMFRGSARMFAYDPQALAAASAALDDGVDRRLRAAERQFLYMPLMHSEDVEVQRRCVSLFEATRDELDGRAREAAAFALRFAEQHRDIIERFRRFPHRNELLGRESSDEERAFLSQPGSSF